MAKVLVIEQEGIHLLLYKNAFTSRPKTVDPATLSIGTPSDEDGLYGIGHLPLSCQEWQSCAPVFLMQGAVTQDELEGYRYWRDDGGGPYFDSSDIGLFAALETFKRDRDSRRHQLRPS